MCGGGGGGGCGERRQERKYCHPDRYIKITGDYIVKQVGTTNRTCVLLLQLIRVLKINVPTSASIYPDKVRHDRM